jgi:hypothetical protein
MAKVEQLPFCRAPCHIRGGQQPSCPPTNFRFCHILQVPLGLMIKAVSNDGSSLAVRMRAKTPDQLPRWRRTSSKLGRLHYATFHNTTLNLRMCYTRRDNLRCGHGTRDARTPMINREDLAQDNPHRDSSPTFWLQGPPLVPLR